MGKTALCPAHSLRRPQGPPTWDPQGPQEAPHRGAGLCLPFQPPPHTCLREAAAWWSGSQALVLALCCRRRFSTWLQRKTFSDSWALSTFPSSQEMPDPISWPPLPLSGNGGCHVSQTLCVFWSLNVSRWKMHCCPKSSPLPSGSPVCVDHQPPTYTQFKLS